MVRQAFRDSTVFWAYIGTKVGVFAIAAIATWPLARLIGSRAWIGLGVFGGLLTILTLAVLFGPSSKVSSDNDVNGFRVAEDSEEHFDLETPVQIPVEDSIDLHPFPPRDVPDVVDAYLGVAVENGFTEVRLIHGRGIGVQRNRVQKLLTSHPLISGFHDAPADRGGWGATIVYLKPRP